MNEKNLKPHKLTEKEGAFCYNFVCDPICRYNATQSAIKAGYSKKIAFKIAYNNLKKEHIRNRVEELKEIYRLDNKDLEEKIILERSKIAFSDIGEMIDKKSLEVGDLENVDSSVIQSIKFDKDGSVKISLYDKLKALDGLASYLGIDKKVIKGEIKGFLSAKNDEEIRKLSPEELKELLNKIDADNQ